MWANSNANPQGVRRVTDETKVDGFRNDDATREKLTSLVVEGGHRLAGRATSRATRLGAAAAGCLSAHRRAMRAAQRAPDHGRPGDGRLLAGLGADVSGVGTSTLRVSCARVVGEEPDRRLVGRLRGSVLLCGPLLARLGRVRLAPPGGDFPARRTLSAHLQALEAMGVRRREATDADYVLEAPDGLLAASIYLEEASVTGTETALLAAAVASGESEIRHAACGAARGRAVPVPDADGGRGRRCRHVDHQDRRRTPTGWRRAPSGRGLCRGGELGGRGGGDRWRARSTWRPSRPSGTDHDRTEADAGRLRGGRRAAAVRPSSPVGVRQITTAPWPGFPSDMVSLISVLATQATGRTLIHDWMYELRLFALEPVEWEWVRTCSCATRTG